MNTLEKVREWLQSFPGTGRLRTFYVDYYAAEPDNGSLDPSGLVEISRTEDILGNVTVENQLNFALYYVFAKAPGDDAGAVKNADWVMELQQWIQEQSVRRLAPVFGDEPKREQIKAQNGAVFAADEEGTAIYTVQLSINYKMFYEVN